jgi:glycosyltransferase involved in cell wall biosynthesis
MPHCIELPQESVVVSVVIATYNRREHIEKPLKSLERQTFQQFEVVIVDDGSTDGTDELIKDWQKKSALPIRYTFQRNQGVATARNTGVRMSRGKYIAFLDSDDEYFPEALSQLVSAIKELRSPGISYAKLEISVNNSPAHSAWGYIHPATNDRQEMFWRLAASGHTISLTTSLTDRSLFGDVSFDRRMITGEDRLFFLQASLIGPMVGIDQIVTLVHRGHKSEVFRGTECPTFDEKILCKIILESLDLKPIGRMVFRSRFQSYHYLYYAKAYLGLNTGYYLQCLARAFLYNPLNLYFYKHIVGDLFSRKIRNR